MFKARTIILIFLAVIIVSWASGVGLWKRWRAWESVSHPRQYSLAKPWLEKLKTQAKEARTFTQQNKYNPDVCFLIDMSIPSGQNRFFVYDLEKDSVINAGLVAHGNCNQFWLEGRQYGNTVGCGCTSLGKYRIGYPYKGRFGQAFKLYGLDKTNDMAFNRFVVLHSYTCVPETEVKDEICQSNGCPMVAPGFLETLKPVINNSKRPVLLWIYESTD